MYLVERIFISNLNISHILMFPGNNKFGDTLHNASNISLHFSKQMIESFPYYFVLYFIY